MDNEQHGGEKRSGSRPSGTGGNSRQRGRDRAAQGLAGAGPAAAPLRGPCEPPIQADWWDDSGEPSEASERLFPAWLPAVHSSVGPSSVVPGPDVADAVQPRADAPPLNAPTPTPPCPPRAPRPGRPPGEPVRAPLYADGWGDDDEPAASGGGLPASKPAPPIASTPALAETAAPARPTRARPVNADPSAAPLNALAAPSVKVGAATSPIPQALGPSPAARLDSRLGPARGLRPAAKSAALASPPILAKLPHASKADHFPAIFCRSALFRVGGADENPDALTGPAGAAAGPVPMEAQGGANLTLEGPWPRMRDKAVWEAAISIAKGRPDAFGPIPVNLSDFAERLGMKDKGGRALEWIWTSLRRLARCRIEFDPPKSSGARIAGHLLLAARQAGRRREIQLDPALAARLLEEDYQFSLDLARRRKLSSALARWLHDFLSTHSDYARPLGLQYLRGLCGYTAAPRRFPAALRAALSEVAAKAPELLESSLIDDSSKSSSEWTVKLASGKEKRRFEQPKAAAFKPPPGSQGGSKARRGGVAL